MYDDYGLAPCANVSPRAFALVGMSPLDDVATIVRKRVTRDSAIADAIARDLAVVCTRGRSAFMNDYAPRVRASHLAAVLDDVSSALGTAPGDVRAVTMHGTTFVVNSRALVERDGECTTFVDLNGDAPTVASGSSDVDEWYRVRAALARAIASDGHDVVDLGDILDASGIALAPPTISGLLLDFPCVYSMRRELMTRAAVTLSSCASSVHSIACQRREQNETVLVYGWSIPSGVALDDGRVREWYDRLSSCLQSLGFQTTHKVTHNSPGSVRIAF